MKGRDFCFIDYDKDLDCVDHNKLWKILQETGIPDHLTCLLIICMQVKKQQLEPDREQRTSCKLGKEHVKAVTEKAMGLPFLLHGIFPIQELNSASPALAGGFSTIELPGKPNQYFI